MNISKTWIIICGFLGFAGVALGAFGAHGLKGVLSAEMLETYKTGIFYHLIHTVVITAIVFSSKAVMHKSALFFLTGVILFSFSLYIYSYTQIKLFAIITPFGGVSFLIGWILLIFEGVRAVKSS
jgi:uncharacterized membrane protein YgdD (TMEM256/DUF423 family)